MDISTDVDQIIAQAPTWNFSGDCALLALIKRISENLQERGERTTQNLREFETNARRVDIALCNATNSLRCLQFGNQFVEYRVEDVDDADLAMPEAKIKPEPDSPLTSEEISRKFLENNLRMFRKNFEPVTIEVPDSDDEDAPVSATTVFRAKNPYDAVPLPYIIGTKEWHEHKCAGLHDSKENSDNEKSEEFSSSSSDERESKPQNKVRESQISDSSSLASFSREPALVSHVRKPDPAAIVPPALTPSDQGAEAVRKSLPRPIISSQRNPHERDVLAVLRQSPPSDDPPSTSSSPSSSPAFGSASARLPIPSTASLSSSSSSSSHQPKLFEEAVSTKPPKETEIKPGQIKRKPVNLFNDDEFNSFMSEITEKVQAKAGNFPVASDTTSTMSQAKEQPKQNKPTQRTANRETLKQSIPTMATHSATQPVNLFDDSPPLSPIPASDAPSRHPPTKDRMSQDVPDLSAIQPKKAPAKKPDKLSKSLFEDDLDDEDFLSSFITKSKPPEQKQNLRTKTSLFDDDDLDIDDIFSKSVNKPLKVPEGVSVKTSLFDDDQDDVTDLFGSKKSNLGKQKESPLNIWQEKIVDPSEPQRNTLFDDLEDENLFGTPKAKIASAPHHQPETIDVEIKKDSKSIDIKTETLENKTNQENEELSENESEHVLRKATPSTDNVQDKSYSEQYKGMKAINDSIPPDLQTSSNKSADLFSGDISDDGLFLKIPGTPAKPKGANETKQTIKPDHYNIASVKDHSSDEESFLKEPKFRNATKSKEIIKPIKDLIEEIDTKEVPEEKKENEPMAYLFRSPEVKPPISETAPPDDNQIGQDPILTIVADVTKKSPKALSTPHKPADISAAQQIIQNYTSLFSDEPPDDSEFFQTLGSSGLSSLSASKIFDSEQDFFEPTLPTVPSASKSTATTPGDQPVASDYGGMRLFSDVPPDDVGDADIETEKPAGSPKVKTASTTTRIHKIFYDDFSETARAGTVPPISNEKPPPADESGRGEIKDAYESPPSSSVKKLKIPNININVQALLPNSGGLPKLPKKATATSSEIEGSPTTTQSPEILPRQNANSLPSPESGLHHVNKTRVQGPARRRPSTRRGRKENYAKSLLEQEDENKIPITTAVGPPKMGGSYLDSPGDDDSEIIPPPPPAEPVALEENSSSTASAFPIEKPTEGQSHVMDAKTKVVISSKQIISHKFVGSFLDSSDEDDSLFSTAKPQPDPPHSMRISNELPKKAFNAPKLGGSSLKSPSPDEIYTPIIQVKTTMSPLANSEPNGAENRSVADRYSRANKFNERPESQSKQQVAPKNKSTLFDDSDQDDNDLFASALPVTATSSKPVQTKLPSNTASSLFSSDEDDEPANMVPKKILPVLISKSLFSDDDDDDDDLFGGGSTSKAKTSKQSNPLSRLASKPAPSKTPTAPATIPASTSDNPLADLLSE
ncbi:hypothetical protein KR009_010266 [Drosophila setifemur]|nr:hypothetical protein KR009_010266 [Drosophila setifemur]